MTESSISRREFLQRSGAAGAVLLLPGLLAACGAAEEATTTSAAGPIDLTGSKIKVGTYGGFFEENFAAIYPDFTAETGIEVESISQPTSEAWVVQLEQAAQAGAIPADVSMLSVVGMLRAMKGDILAGYDETALPNSQYLAPGFVRKDDSGLVKGVGAVSWYITLVSNTERVAESPDTWTALWDPQWEDSLTLLSQPGNAFLLEITAVSFFGGKEILATQDGVEEVLAKLAEVKPNVKLWYRDEATAQQALNTGEVAMGQFYHDITEYAASQGEPLRSVFPKEGAILDSGEWAITKTTENLAACQVFINWMCQPAVQARLARTLGTSPTVAKEHMDLTDEEYASFSGPGPDAAIRPDYRIYADWEDWINQKWTEQIFSE